MKKLKSFFCCLIFPLCFSVQLYSHLLTVVIMVKNEEHVIKQTLQPFVDAGVNHFLVFDTGSTDKTISVTEDFFHEHAISDGVILQESFIDFATSRNRALELAEEMFSESCFFVMPDAEWYLQNVEGLLSFCELHENDSCPAYLIRIVDNFLDFYTARLIRCGSKLRFKGAVHEVPNFFTKEKVHQDVFFNRASSKYGIEKSQKRWVRDYELLLGVHEREPNDSRTVFYLAQTCECLGYLDEACEWYKLRISMNGWDEENFMSLYRLAGVYQRLGNWEKALYYYIQASSCRPHRAEPLVRLAEYFLNVGDKELCFLFARRAVEIPYPDSDILFVEKKLYEFTRYDLLGRSAWYVGEYFIGEEAAKKALEVCPDLDYLQKNLSCYLNRDMSEA